MLIRRSLLLVFFIFTGSVGCVKKTPQQTSIPVLIVNGDVLTAGDFAQTLAKRLKNFDALAAKDPTNVRRTKETLLREFIVSRLLDQFAKAHDLSVTKEEVDEEFDKIRKSYPDDLTFKAGMASEGQTMDEWRAGLKQTLLERKAFALLTPKNISSNNFSSGNLNTEAKNYFDEHKSEFQRPAQIHLQQIVVAKEDDAERILKKLKAGEGFNEMAKRFSSAPEGTKGGDLGYVGKGVLPLFDSAFGMPIGKVSGVIKSSYGFHIMRVLDKRSPGSLSFEQAKPNIFKILLAQKQQESFNKWLEESLRAAKIQRNDALLDKIKIRTEGEQE